MTENRLALLLEAGFTDRLDAGDTALLARRATLKSRYETPSWRFPTNWWYAVPGESYEGLFPALNLHDRFPVTFGEGADVADLPSRPGALPVCVTPELDGWRLIFGNLREVIGLSWDAMTGAVERLSAHCGEAHMFLEDIAGGSDVWIVAEQGSIRRRYAQESSPEWVGDPLPWEELAVDDEDFDPEFDEAEPNEGTVGATTACAYLSVDPTDLGPDTDLRGHAWLALSAPDVGHEGLAALARIAAVPLDYSAQQADSSARPDSR
ncbi:MULTISPECIES: hypothetical protein [unclassified Streptomyces]|uniref:hypothetical protein n=1 Tax=unclassified Streptomyces TaxID=2593676 RepID=UPI002E0EF1ED|nr:hypothetical protein OG533_18150 [Streptomyces sp. NBC_01186]WSS42392.1 hypothetical protein OG220_18760 [Streptomyces sp. NBC_01187]